jgi:acyl-CoA synthetase (AMP-forming)/AMP-acid ligase II
VAALIDTRGMGLWRLIEERAALTPNKRMALDVTERTLTYGEYKAWCERVAAGLTGRGVGEGTRVSWMLPTRLEALVLAGALARLGAVQNPILPIYRQRETGFITRQTGAAMLVVPTTFRNFDYVAMAQEATSGLDLDLVVADPDLPEADPATLRAAPDAPGATRWIFYSSGTTADPKGARHTDLSLSAANDGLQWSLGCGPEDQAAVVFPITHVGGIVWIFNTMQTGAELLLVETFDPAATPIWLGQHGVTLAGAGTFFFLSYLAAQRAHPDGPIMPAVRLFNGGGAPKPPSLHGELMAEMGAPLINGWGLTESPINTMAHPYDSDTQLAETEGRATPGTQLRVVSIEGRAAAAGEEGELQVKGGQVLQGYVDASLDADAFDDGWLRTGDLGTIDGDGYVRITGRLKDVIIRKGENISAKEVEDVLYTHPKVADVAVIGLPDPDVGERACAVVVCQDGMVLSFDEMVDHLRGAGLSTRKMPEQLELVEALPRNPSGKVVKFELRKAYGGP